MKDTIKINYRDLDTKEFPKGTTLKEMSRVLEIPEDKVNDIEFIDLYFNKIIEK